MLATCSFDNTAAVWEEQSMVLVQSFLLVDGFVLYKSNYFTRKNIHVYLDQLKSQFLIVA